MSPEQRKALKLLAAQPTVPGKPWLVSTSLPRASADEYGRKVGEAAREGAAVRDVPISRLHAVQSGVKPEKVARFIAHPDKVDVPGRRNEGGYLTDKPIVVDSGGRLLVHDGHHRIVSAILRGETTVRARVVRADALRAWAKKR